MTKEELLDVLGSHFPTKHDHEELVVEMRSGFKKIHETFATKQDHVDLKQEVSDIKNTVRNLAQETRDGFEVINKKLDDLKASSNAVDKMLEQNPIPRIERLEHHVGLSPFAPSLTEE